VNEKSIQPLNPPLVHGFIRNACGAGRANFYLFYLPLDLERIFDYGRILFDYGIWNFFLYRFSDYFQEKPLTQTDNYIPQSDD